MAHVVQPLAALIRTQPTRILSYCGDRSQTVGQFAERVAAISALLTQKYELRSGDRVAVAAINADVSFQYMLAILDGGGLLTLINWRWSLTDAVQALTPCSPTILIVDSACDQFASLSSHVPSIKSCLRMEHQLLDDTKRLFLADKLGPQLQLNAPQNGGAVLCFTSGTTAAPKAAVLSHNSLHTQSMSKLLNLGYCEEDVYYHAAPLCHIGGLSSALAMLMASGTHVFPGRFEAATMLEHIETHQVTCSIMVPAMLSALAVAGHPRVPRRSLKRLLIGGGTPSPANLQYCREMFPAARVSLSYAMTETCSSMTFSLLASPSLKTAPPGNVDALEERLPTQDSLMLGSMPTTGAAAHANTAVCVGHPAAGVEIGIRPLNGLPAGQGIITTRGPHLMSGYWSDGGLSLVRRPASWFETGDVGYLDSTGQLWLAGRLKDTIRTGSETVHASEVERCLTSHPAIVSAAVVGLPDNKFGQQVAALVQLRGDGDEADEKAFITPFISAEWQKDLQAYCRLAGLSGFKIPRTVACQCQSLPVNSSGKVLKVEVAKIIRGGDVRGKL